MSPSGAIFTLLCGWAVLANLGASAMPDTSGAQWTSRPVLQLLANTSSFDFLSRPDWHARLEREVVPLLAAASPAGSAAAAQGRQLRCRSAVDLECLVAELLRPVPKTKLPPCPPCIMETKCQLKAFSVIASLLVKQLNPNKDGTGSSTAPGLAGLSKQALRVLNSAAADLEVGLVATVGFLRRHQHFHAQAMGLHVGVVLGWDWVLPMLGLHDEKAFRPCWDQVAVMLRGSNYNSMHGDNYPGVWISDLLRNSSMTQTWLRHLNDFYLGSLEHAHPWVVHGNLLLSQPQQPLFAGIKMEWQPESATSAPPPNSQFATTVQWALPINSTRPLELLGANIVESPAFVAAGYAWRAGMYVPLHGKPGVGITLWEQHHPPGPQLFKIYVIVMGGSTQQETGRTDFYATSVCVWPEEFNENGGCFKGAESLRPTLTGKSHEYVEHGELLVQLTVEAIPGTDGVAPRLGPLGGTPRLFSSPLLRLGYLLTHGMWGTHGFNSKRLPSTSGMLVLQELNKVNMDRYFELMDAQDDFQAEASEAKPTPFWRLVRYLRKKEKMQVKQAGDKKPSHTVVEEANVEL